MDSLLASAVDLTDVSSDDSAVWFLESPRRACAGEEPEIVGEAPGNDEFERRSAEQGRSRLRAEYLGRTYRIPADQLEKRLSSYDFRRGGRRLFLYSESFTFTGRVEADCEDAACSWRQSLVDDRAGPDELVRFLPMTEAEGRVLTDAEGIDVDVVVRVGGVARHIRCFRTCLSLFGATDCGLENGGAGLKLKGTVVALRIRGLGRTLVSEFGR